MTDETKDPKGIPWWRIVLGVGAAYALFYSWALSQTHATLIAHYGALGDSFAPLTAFASTVGLIGALVSVNLQRRELALQRRELELQRQEMQESRAELKRTAAAQEAQVKALEAAAAMAEQQKTLLEESAKAARLQAVAAAWIPIAAFLGDVREAVARIEAWHLLLVRQLKPNGPGMDQMVAFRLPTPPLILADREYDVAERIVGELSSAYSAMLNLFGLTGQQAAKADVREVATEVEQALARIENLLIAFRMAMSKALQRDR